MRPPVLYTPEPISSADIGAIEEIARLLQSIQSAREAKRRPVERTVHPKQHGTVLAELMVEPGLPRELAQGLFEKPGRFRAIARFSNSKLRDDRLPDAHGMAIKVFAAGQGAAMTTQDFVLVDHPVFFARDAGDLLPVVREAHALLTGGALVRARTALKGLLSLDHRFRLIRRMGLKRPVNPLQVQYWSATPFRYGDFVGKFSVRPLPLSGEVESPGGKDRLRLAMRSTLRSHEAVFEVLVQLRRDADRMPVGDATVPWDETVSPYLKVALLRISPQEFDTPARRQFGENLSFDPWHALPAHEPLGSINRCRRRVYQVMAGNRRQMNGAALSEPTEAELRSVFEHHV
jgi:hypothetical protein